MHRSLLEIRARWLGALAEHERRAGRWDHAERLVDKALDVADRVEAETDGGASAASALRIRLLNCLGMICKYRGHFADGARAYLHALRLARRRYGPSHPAITTLYHNLGGLEHARGRYKRGEPFARRALELRERAHGARHPDVARDAAALAGILDGLRQYDEAESLHRRALAVFEGRRWRRPADHREIAYTLANLAACLHLQGRSTEALPFAVRALHMQEKILGPSHPEVLPTRSNLAVIQGR